MSVSSRQRTYPPVDPAAALWSRSPASSSQNLLIMIHGWSYDERHLFALRHDLPSGLTVVSVRAPIPEAGGYAWFPSSGNPIGNPRPSVANAAVTAMMGWYDTLPPYRRVGLLGFSQGGAMVLQMMRHRPAAFAFGVQLGGFVIDDDQLGDADLAAIRPPVFWGRGARDSVIPAAAITRTATFSTAHTTVTEKVYENLGHDVAGQEIVDLATFVADNMI